MSYKLTPLDVPGKDEGQGRVVVVRREQPEKVGSLYIPDNYRNENAPAEGDVIAASAKCSRVQRGDHIVFNLYTGAEIELQKKKLLVMREEDVLARIEEIPDDPEDLQEYTKYVESGASQTLLA